MIVENKISNRISCQRRDMGEDRGVMGLIGSECSDRQTFLRRLRDSPLKVCKRISTVCDIFARRPSESLSIVDATMPSHRSLGNRSIPHSLLLTPFPFFSIRLLSMDLRNQPFEFKGLQQRWRDTHHCVCVLIQGPVSTSPLGVWFDLHPYRNDCG